MTVRESPNGNGITNVILYLTRKELDSINCATLFENRKSLIITDRELFYSSVGIYSPLFQKDMSDLICTFRGKE